MHSVQDVWARLRSLRLPKSPVTSPSQSCKPVKKDLVRLCCHVRVRKLTAFSFICLIFAVSRIVAHLWAWNTFPVTFELGVQAGVVGTVHLICTILTLRDAVTDLGGWNAVVVGRGTITLVEPRLAAVVRRAVLWFVKPDNKTVSIDTTSDYQTW